MLFLFLIILFCCIIPYPCQIDIINISNKNKIGDYIIAQNNSLIGTSQILHYEKGIKIIRVVTAYSSTEDQCDSTPFITANNEKVRDGIVASNEFEFGQKIMIDNKIYVVADRMNKRYKNRIDIWKFDRAEAINFGKQIKEITLLK